MAGAETAKMVASLDLKDNLSKGLQTAGKNIDGFSRKLASSRAVAVGLGVGLERIAEKGISALGNAIGDGIQGALTLEKATNATQAVIESTGHAAGVSAAQVRDLANALEDMSGADDKTIQQGENLLLTFTKIGSKTFPDAAKAMVNMAIALNKGDAATADFDGAAIQLGKALQDPVKGITALRKAGVSFTKDQQKQINALVKAGKTTDAQRIILAELEKEFGKAGKAANQGFAGDLNRYNDSIEDAEIAIAQGLIPALGEVARELTTVFRDPAVMSSLRDFGKNIGEGIKGAVAFAKSIPWDKVGQGLSIAAEAAKTVVGAFTSLQPWVQAAVISGWGLNKITGGAVTSVITGLAGNIGKTLLQSLGLMTISAATVVVNGPVAGAGGVPGAAAGAAGLGLGATLIGAAGAAIIGGLIAEAVARPLGDLIQPGLGTAADTGTMLGNRDPRRFDEFGRVIANTTGEIKGLGHAADVSQDSIEAMRGAFGQPDTRAGKAIDDATFAQTLRDIPVQLDGNQAAINDNGTKIDAVTQGILGNLVPSVNVGAHNTSLAATQAGQAAARQTFASGLGIEGAIRASQPITNVKVEISATNVTAVNVVSDRGGERNGSRDGDGGGGPGQ